MKIWNNNFCYLLGYFSVIFLFSCIYYFGLWKNDVGNFIVANSVGSSMLTEDGINNVSSLDKSLIDLDKKIKSSYFANRYREQFNELQNVKYQKRPLVENYLSLLPQVTSILTAINRKEEQRKFREEDNIRNEFSHKGAALSAQITKLKTTNIAQLSKVDSVFSLIEVSDLKYKLSEVERQKELAIYEYKSKDEPRLKVDRSEVTQSEYELLVEFSKISRKLNELNNRIKLIASDLKNDVQEYRKRLDTELEYRDFLYFSCIAGTTSGFGDIVPASKIARILVSAEIIICILIIGFAINQLGKKEEKIK